MSASCTSWIAPPPPSVRLLEDAQLTLVVSEGARNGQQDYKETSICLPSERFLWSVSLKNKIFHQILCLFILNPRQPAVRPRVRPLDAGCRGARWLVKLGGRASVKKHLIRQPHGLYTGELESVGFCEVGIVGIGRFFLLIAEGAEFCGATAGTGIGRLFFTERSLRMPWATLSISSTVVCMAAAISFLVSATKLGSLAWETRPPFTKAWEHKNKWSERYFKQWCFLINIIYIKQNLTGVP